MAGGLGFLLGAFYDVFRVIRLLMRPSAKVVFFQDLLFFALSSVVTFLFALAVTGGGAAFLSVPGPRYRLYGLLFYHRPGGDALRQERHRRDSVAVARPLEGDFFPVPPSLETFTPSHLLPGSIFL